MGVLKATIGTLDVSAYLKGLQVSPGGDGRVGSATLTLTKEAAGLDIRPMMVVQVWETFDTSGNGVASRGRFFGGLVRNRDTGNIGTTKTWDLSCDDFNLIGTRGLVRDMEASKAVSLTAGTFEAQVTQLTTILQYNGALGVNTEINTTDAVSLGALAMPAVTYEGGHTYFWYLGQLCAKAVELDSALRPTFYLGTSITVGGSEDFGPPTLYLFDKVAAAANPPAFVFSDTPGVGEYPIYPEFQRKSASNEIAQRQQLRTPSQVLTGENATAQAAYPNPYINHGGASNTGYWMAEPLTPSQVVDNTAAQALIDRKVESAGYPRDSYRFDTDQRPRVGEYVSVTWALEGLSDVVLQVVETEYRVDPTLEVWCTLTLNARRLKLGESAEDDIYAPPVEGDTVPPLPPENFTLVSNLYNPATGKTELSFSWDPSPSADTGMYQILAYISGGYAVVWEGDNDSTEAVVEWEPGAAYEIVARAVDTSGNLGIPTTPALTGTASVQAWASLANPSFDYIDRLDFTRPRYWDRVLVGDGGAFSDDTEQMHGPRSLRLDTFGGPIDAAAVLSELFVAEGLDALRYELRLFAKSTNAGETLEWVVTQYLADGTPDTSRARSGSFTLTTDWAEYADDIVMFGDAPYMKLQLGFAATTTRSVWVDHVTMTPQTGTTGLRDLAVTVDKLGAGGSDGDVLTNVAGVVEWAAPGSSGGSAVMATLNYVIDGRGSAIATGAYPPFQFDFSGTIESVTLLGDPTHVGSCVLDIWSDAYGNYPPTVADSITASAKPTLSSATKYQDATLTGWDTAITAGDSWIINVDSASTLQYVTLAVKIRRTSGGGTGAAALDDLTDVVITTPASGEVLTYDGTNWVNDTAGAGSLALDDLTDVTITTPSTGAVLKYNGTAWIDDAEAGIPPTLLDAKGDIIVATAADTAARLAVGGTNGHVLTVDSAEATGLKWAAQTGGGASALDDLTDVVITTPTTNDVLLYNGTNWVNDTSPGGGGGGGATYDTYANIPAAGTAGALFIPSDGHTMWVDDGTVWRPIVDGVVGAKPTAYASATWVNQGTATGADSAGALTMKTTAAGSDVVRALVWSIGGSTFTKTFALRIMPSGLTNWSAGPLLRESGTGELVLFGTHNNGTQMRITKWNSPTSFSADTFASTAFHATWAGGTIWFQIQQDATNRYYRISKDGRNFVQITSTLVSDFLSPDQIGIGIYHNDGTQDVRVTLLSYS